MFLPQDIFRSMLEGSVNLYSAKYFYTMDLAYLILRIIISLVGFINPCTVCITIKKITTFPIWNTFPLLFRIIFSFFFFLLIN